MLLRWTWKKQILLLLCKVRSFKLETKTRSSNAMMWWTTSKSTTNGKCCCSLLQADKLFYLAITVGYYTVMRFSFVFPWCPWPDQNEPVNHRWKSSAVAVVLCSSLVFFAVCLHAAVTNTSGTAGISVGAPSQCLWPLEQPAEAGNAKIRLYLHNTVQMSLCYQTETAVTLVFHFLPYM